MIRNEELMIGDWVRIKSDKEPDDAYWLHDMQPGQALKVTEILSYGINPDWCCGEINDCVPEDAIEPIPLTPEILEKNGFKPGIISWILWDEETDECLIMLKRINNAFIFPPLAGMSFGIQYVHELQHLFRLGGIEKSIEL